MAAPPGEGVWRLDGRVALVSGASSGLGARFVRVLHLAGAYVVATARRGDRLDELGRELGDRFEAVSGDIADGAHRLALVRRSGDIGRLDVLVNNAGICDDGPIEEQSLSDLVRVVEVNLVSVLDACHDLIDEYGLYIHPTVIGPGRPMLRPASRPIRGPTRGARSPVR